MKRAITTITTLLFLLTLMGCEVHTYPGRGYGSSKWQTSSSSYHTSTVKLGGHQTYNNDYCYELPFDYCCAYYEYTYEYSGLLVCKVTECYDYHTYEWYYEGEECWYE